MLKERCESRRNGREFIPFHCECLANGISAMVLHSPKFEQAQKVLRVFSEWGMKPYHTEINLFHIGMRCGVQPDLLLLDSAPRVVIVDWKRTKKTDNGKQLWDVEISIESSARQLVLQICTSSELIPFASIDARFV